jgi:threonine synthase
VSVHGDHLVCAGCGAEVGSTEPYPFRCPRAAHARGDVDHVLRRRLHAETRFPTGHEANPYIRYRSLLHCYQVARGGGMTDEGFCALVRRLDDAVAEIDGHGFTVTPFARSDDLSERLGFTAAGGVWVKDETQNVSGSHKARHLFGVLLQLEVAEAVGLADAERRPDLAIASCGNAALAAAVLAAAAGRALRVFVPEDADPAVIERLADLGARVGVCRRPSGTSGDPAYAALLEALDEGALPFTCQGNLNGLAVEGGETLGYEVVSQLAASWTRLDRIVVQVGGGALASAVSQSLLEAVELGVLEHCPRIDTVQTAAGWPLRRAFDLVTYHGNHALPYAARHRSEFMWPWEPAPQSIAGGILDDETYDWLAVVEGMLASGGRPVVAPEATLLEAHRLARAATGIDVDPTGASGLAGLLALRAAERVGDRERVAVLFTGVTRTHDDRKESRNEELPRTRHLVAEGLRAG